MPGRLDPEEAAQRRRKRSYTTLRAQLLAFTRGRVLGAARTKLKERKPSAAYFALDAMLARAVVDGRLASGYDLTSSKLAIF